jgi:AAA domain-containing protein
MASSSTTKEEKKKIASVLAKVTTGNPDAPWKILIYGFKGVGKSTFAARCPGVVVIPIEEGVNQLRVPQLPQITSWIDLHAALDALLAEEHGYKAVCLDGIDSAEALVVAFIEEELRSGKREYTTRKGKKCRSLAEMNDDYGSGYKAVVDEWRLVNAKLDRLRNERKMRVLLVGHTKAVRVENLEGPDYDRWQVKALGKGTGEYLGDWSDYVLFARRETRTLATGTGATAKIIGVDGDTVIQCRGTAAYDAKARGDIPWPEKLPLNWDVFAETADLITRHGRDLPAKLQSDFDAALASMADEERKKKAIHFWKEAVQSQNYATQAHIVKMAQAVPVPSGATTGVGTTGIPTMTNGG